MEGEFGLLSSTEVSDLLLREAASTRQVRAPSPQRMPSSAIDGEHAAFAPTQGDRSVVIVVVIGRAIPCV